MEDGQTGASWGMGQSSLGHGVRDIPSHPKATLLHSSESPSGSQLGKTHLQEKGDVRGKDMCEICVSETQGEFLTSWDFSR